MRTSQPLSSGLLCAAWALLAGFVAQGHAQSAGSAAEPSYAYATNGVMDGIEGAGGVKWKLVLSELNLGGKELEVAEVLLPAGTATPNHTHAPLEVLYVLEGTYDHEVNGHRYRLTPGMVGIVRPGDQVRHLATNGTDVKLLVLWVPGGTPTPLTTAQGTVPAPVPEVSP